jgi:hypothetical protein
MAQTTNAIVFRLGIKKNEWDYRYFEKSKEEFTLYNYQNIQIQNYIKQYLNKYGLILHRTKFSFNDTNLHIFISYISTQKSIYLIKKSKKAHFINVIYRQKRRKRILIRKKIKKKKKIKIKIKKKKKIKITNKKNKKKKKKLKGLALLEKIEKRKKKAQLKELKRKIKETRILERALERKERKLMLKRKRIRIWLRKIRKQWIAYHNIYVRKKKWRRRRVKFTPNISTVSRITKKKPMKAYLLNKRIQLKRTTIGWYYQQKERRWSRTYGLKIRRAKIVRRFKRKLYKINYITNEKLKKNSFLEELLEGLSIFIGKKFHVYLTFQNLNRGLNLELLKKDKGFFRKTVFSLKRYSKDKFFKESFNIMYIVTKIKSSAQLLASFLAKQLPLLKRHNYFLVFLKRILSAFIFHKSSKIKGVKVLISGRFNGAPRAKSRIITVGFTPILTISNSIDYFETTCYTKNGTFGIKIWISPN